jgi:hypothetical protein
MKWFRKWMLESLRKASAEEQSRVEDIESDYDDGTPPSPSTYAGLSKGLIPMKKRRGLNIIHSNSDMDLPEGGLNIQVKSAIGGKIVIFRSYDDRNDRNCYSTYLIPDTERFEESLGKIITMESLKL